MKDTWNNKLEKRLTTRHIAIFLLVISLVLGNSIFKSETFFQDFVPNVVTEFIGIAITILLIEELNERREKRKLRDRLKRELWSKDQGITLRAINELREHGWLADGGLENINLPYSVLDRAELKGVIMNGANFHKASLQRSYIGHAQLRNVNFSGANLSYSILNHSDLTGSDLTGALLDGASFENVILANAKISETQLLSIKSLKGAIMPNGVNYESWIKKNRRKKNITQHKESLNDKTRRVKKKVN